MVFQKTKEFNFSEVILFSKFYLNEKEKKFFWKKKITNERKKKSL